MRIQHPSNESLPSIILPFRRRRAHQADDIQWPVRICLALLHYSASSIAVFSNLPRQIVDRGSYRTSLQFDNHVLADRGSVADVDPRLFLLA